MCEDGAVCVEEMGAGMSECLCPAGRICAGQSCGPGTFADLGDNNRCDRKSKFLYYVIEQLVIEYTGRDICMCVNVTQNLISTRARPSYFDYEFVFGERVK